MNIDSILRGIGEQEEVFIVQVGAMDGRSFDDIRGYIDLFSWSGLFVEPMPEMYTRLVESYDEAPKDSNLIFENSAISDKNGEIEFIRIPPKVVDDNLVHCCFNGMSSVYPPKNGLGSEGDRETVEKYSERLSVPCLTLDTLLEKHDIHHMDIFACDAEGHDWEIFKQFNFKKYKPKYIKLEVCCLSDEDIGNITSLLTSNGYQHQVIGQDIHATPLDITDVNEVESVSVVSDAGKPADNLTIVTGIWDLSRDKAGDGFKRPFSFYTDNLIKLLKTDVPMIVYIESKYISLVEEHRKGMEDITDIRIRELSDFKNLECFDSIQDIRKSASWLGQADWLSNSTQATLEYYNPMVMSKMFMLNDAVIWNPFGTEYFAWIDGGITNTVHEGYFTHDKIFDKITNHLQKFFFVSFPYTGNTEIHGFCREGMNEFCEVGHVDYVCRGGFFGGHIDNIREANAHYYSVLNQSIHEGYMGTEESVFTIMSHQQPDDYDRFMIEDNGLINNFFEHVKNNDVVLQKPSLKINRNPLDIDLRDVKTRLYVITYNSPQQFEALIRSYDKQPGFIDQTDNFVVNNSTDRSTDAEYTRICKMYNFTEIKKDNIGICGGRQFVAQHFDQSDADLYIFLEDDMMLKDESFSACRTGMPGYVPGLYHKIQKIIIQEGYDFIKLSFSEFYGDNNTQWAWYNVPSHFRLKHWPDHPRLPRSGLAKNPPKTKFNNIGCVDELPYIDGEVYYSNWPQILSKPGNKKMFIDTSWDHPHEQTWMSHMFQLTINEDLHGAILLASPINHDRFDHYDRSERVES